MKVYGKEFGPSLGPYDRAFCDIRNGTIKLGEIVRVWDDEAGYYKNLRAELFYGEPSLAPLEPKYRSVGQYIRAHRTADHRSLREVAKHIGCSATFLGEVERGVKRRLAEKYWSSLKEILPHVDLDKLKELNNEGG